MRGGERGAKRIALTVLFMRGGASTTMMCVNSISGDYACAGVSESRGLMRWRCEFLIYDIAVLLI